MKLHKLPAIQRHGSRRYCIGWTQQEPPHGGHWVGVTYRGNSSASEPRLTCLTPQPGLIWLPGIVERLHHRSVRRAGDVTTEDEDRTCTCSHLTARSAQEQHLLPRVSCFLSAPTLAGYISPDLESRKPATKYPHGEDYLRRLPPTDPCPPVTDGACGSSGAPF